MAKSIPTITLASLTAFVAVSVRAGTFADAGIGLPGVVLGSVSWGDYDNDGKLDILITGNAGSAGYITEVWHNQGNGTFAKLNLGLPTIFKSCAAWGDYDKDGKLDFVLAGLDENLNPICQIWHNQGNGTFVNSNILLPGLSGGTVTWADFDNDGNLDLLLTGADVNGAPLTQVWRNLGNATFGLLNTGLTPVTSSAVAVADFDNDGNLDILLTGMNASNSPITQIWRNLGNGTFANVATTMPGVYSGAVAVGDYDNDGRMDILLTGESATGKVAQVWHNLGNFTFTNINAGLPGVYSGSVAWGDFDNDGKPDILLSGYSGAAASVCQVWRNAGNGTFTNWNAGLMGIGSSSVAVGDFDNNGTLDILAAGNGSTFVSTLWRNVVASSNEPPSAPVGLAAVPTSAGVTLSWNPATDSTTPASGLSYNLRLGTSPGGAQIISPCADPVTGFRRLPQPGNVRSALAANLALPPGLYYWSVQAIDASYSGSPFSQEFTVALGALATTAPASQVTFNSAYFNGTVNPQGEATTVSFQWGTTTSYGNTLSVGNVGNSTTALSVNQPALSLQAGTTYHYRVVAADAFTVTYGADVSFTTPLIVPPTLSSFTNVATAVNTTTPAIPFTVSDVNVTLSALVISATSSDITLVPAANLVLGGSGANRTLTITPATNAQGTTAITVSVSDGVTSVSKTFLLTIESAGTGTSFSGQITASGGFAVGTSVGLTTNIYFLAPGGTTNQLQFVGGILTRVVASTPLTLKPVAANRVTDAE